MSELIEFSRDITSAFSSLSLKWKLTVGGVLCIVGAKAVFFPLAGAFLALTRPIRLRFGKYKQTDKFEAGKIYLHMFPRQTSVQVPNLSPYAIKVETWFRLQKITYEVVETYRMSKRTRQIPYVIYDDEEIVDSNAIIEFFAQEREVDETEGLTEEQQGAAKAFITMVDELTAWTYFLHRYFYNFPLFTKRCLRLDIWRPVKYMVERNFPKALKTRADAQGIGRKTEEEVNQIAFSHLHAISQYLGEKKFMMGDNITTVDCAIFGHLSQFMYVDFPYPHMPFIKVYCKNLLPYMDRIKQELWPDWNELA